MHELQAAADVAERRGVAVDIEIAGPLPGVPAGIRRVITDAAIPVLVAARSRARITTRELTGWQPTQPGLIEDLQKGHYFNTPNEMA